MSSSPSVREMRSVFHRSIRVSSPHMNRAMDESTSIGSSFTLIPRLAGIGVTIAMMPTTRRRSKMLAPTISPIPSEALPSRVDIRATTKSGVDEPNATTVSPITTFEILKRRAIASAPSVR